MLTKDLLRFRLANGSLKPSFVQTGDPALLEMAASLTAVYEKGVGERRAKLEEAASQLTGSARDLKLSRGLDKIALDRCEFSACADADYPTLRKAVFARSFELLKQRSFESAASLRASVFAGCAKELSFLREGLYEDLPDNERLASMKKLYPKELLERYNCSLAQSLLLYCARIEAKVYEPDPAKLRRLFKYLKFFRLLAKISLDEEPAAKTSKNSKKAKKEEAPAAKEATEAAPSRLKLEIDGPASLFDSSSKYGLQLASFFPALIQASEWAIDCEIKMRERKLRLKLDQTSGLVSHYSNFGAYVPEEVALFHKLFKEKSEDWRVAGGSPFLRAENGELLFPDFSFEGPSGTRVHLELFHKWHSTQLPARLAFCERNPGLKLALGVDRSLLSDASLKEALDASAHFAAHGFLFRDFPGVETTRGVLNSFLPKAKKR